MKKTVLFIFTFIFSLLTNAQFSGNGFYRVQNPGTLRYLTVVDNRASVNVATTDPDLAAILPIRKFERIVGNPASVIYIYHAGGNNYSLRAQNVDSYDIMGIYLNLRKLDDGTYYAWATARGLTKYLFDENSGRDDGWLDTKGEETNKKWNIIPLNSSSDNYFAAVPEFELNGYYYSTMYSSFPYKASSDGIKMYYVSLLTNNIAVLKEVEDNFVTAASPVISQCASADYANNRLDVLETGGSTIVNNCLNGVYFNNGNGKHMNRVAYDSNTMRILGKTSDGSLGFITADIDYLPANKAYLTVPAGSAKEIKLITEEEYETGIDDIRISGGDNNVYYDLSGRRVESPRNGVYVSANGKKICK